VTHPSKRKPPKPQMPSFPGKHGPKPHAPTEQLRNLVKWLRIAGYRETKVAEAMSLDAKTIRKHYREELDHSKGRVDAMVTSSLVMNAVGGPEKDWQKANMSAAIWYTKTQMGWHEPKQEIEHSGAVGVYDPERLKDMSDVELTTLAAILARLTPQSSTPDDNSGGDST
jgi:hypothetical protein